jgi:hypothetical protein
MRDGITSFPIGRYGKGTSYVAKFQHWLRRGLRAVVTDRDGATTLYHESLICDAAEHEGRRLLLKRRLRLDGENLKPLEYATILDKIGLAGDARTRCLRRLGLEADAAKPSNLAERWRLIRAREAQDATVGDAAGQGDPEAVPDARDATAGQPNAVATVDAGPHPDGESRVHFPPPAQDLAYPADNRDPKNAIETIP